MSLIGLIRSGHFSLMTKLSVLVTFAVLIVLVLLGYYFDSFLKERFQEDTQLRMMRGYERLTHDLKNFERDLRDGIAFIKTDEKTIASIELINNYQDKNNYNAFLIDEEKKALAEELLSRVKLSFNDAIVLYDQNGELVAYVTRENGIYQLNYISFVNGERTVFSRSEQHMLYTRNASPLTIINIDMMHRDYYAPGQLQLGSLVTYHRLADSLLLKSHQSIFRGDSGKVIGHIELSRILGESYFGNLSSDVGVMIFPDFVKQTEDGANVLGEDLLLPTVDIKQTEEEFFGRLKKEVVDGNVYFKAVLDKASLKEMLDRSRMRFLLLLVVVAAFTLLLMRFVIRRNLAQPLAELMGQIRKIEKQDYTASPQIDTGDEMQEISASVNQLAAAVQEREKMLEQSRNEQEYLSLHDSLTDLPNRRSFSQQLKRSLESARSSHAQLAILFLDLDQFKLVNDTLGHDVGDKLLVQVAHRLSNESGASLALARIGGDEFNILVENTGDMTALKQVAERYIAIFQSPFQCAGRELSISASIGIAVYPKDGEDAVTLVKHADLAMYKSKDKGRNSYSFYSEELSEELQIRADMTQALRQAIDAGDQFELHYQPKVLAKTGQLHAVEALVRWNRPGHGCVPPGHFISLAEETGLIIQIGQWVMRQGCHDFMQMREEGLQLNHISINVSSIQLQHDKTINELGQTIRESGISAEQLELEITESFIANDSHHAIQRLRAFRELGVQLAIDDFGTGYSSMSYLHQLPVTRLKIDKSFVDGLPGSNDSVSLTRAIIGLAKSFGLHTTAEGVENAEQLAFLVNEQCEEIQGYFFAKPMPLAELKSHYWQCAGESNVVHFPKAIQ